MTEKLCLIEGCDHPVKARGYCSRHYQRLMTFGDPLGGGTYSGEPRRFFEETVLTYKGDDCLIWPYGKDQNGYGKIHVGDTIRFVHRLACEAINGPPPSKDHQAAHSCGNGRGGCVNPNHTRWATQVENEKDKLIHGTHIRGENNVSSKFKETDIHKIRQSYAKGEYTQRQLGDKYGVHQVYISQIITGKKWGWLETPL